MAEAYFTGGFGLSGINTTDAGKNTHQRPHKKRFSDIGKREVHEG